MAGVPISFDGDLLGSNGAARALLYDASGNPLVRSDLESFPSGNLVRGLHQMGVAGDMSRAITVSKYGRLDTPNRRLMLFDPIAGATINGQRWVTTATTMTAAQLATGITLNNSAITTTTTGVALSSRSMFQRAPTSVLSYRVRIRSTLVANQEGIAGLVFQATLSGTAVLGAGDAGAFWKFGTDGTIKPAAWFNGAEVFLGTDITGLAGYSSADYYDYNVQIEEDRVTFLVLQASNTGDVYVVSEQTWRLADTQQKHFAVTHLAAYQRVRNNSAPASAGQLLILEPQVSGLEIDHNLLWDQQLAENTMGASISPTAFTQLAQFANSAAPASATLSNTAAGYATLGGLWQFANLAGAATDYCLFGFVIPSPYRLKIRGIRIDAWNTGAANAATPATLLAWGIGVNGASANLSSGGHIRRMIGAHAIPISAAIGAPADKVIDVSYDVPLICEPGTTLAIILRVVAGAATAAQVIQGSVDVRGVFE